ncbi:MAG TPA: PAS domain-containing protein, partial [Gemmataceae bacterium]|nr:PAS domain-containing protein [Gemmataceae bacterium]
MPQLKSERRRLHRTAAALRAPILCLAAVMAAAQASSDESTTSPASKRALAVSEAAKAQRSLIGSIPELRFKFQFEVGGEPTFAMLQDADGFIWVGGFYAGLTRFDGYSGKQYREAQGTIASNYVTQVMEDSRLQIWIGTSSGISRYDKRTDRFTTYRAKPGDPKALSNDSFNLNGPALAESPDGGIWMGTGGGLSRFDPQTESFQTFHHDDRDPRTLAGESIRTIAMGHGNALWIAYDGAGFDRFDVVNHEVTRYRHDPADPASLPADDVMSTQVDAGGIVWLGTVSSGLIRFDPEAGSFKQYVNRPGDPTSVPAVKGFQWKILSTGELLPLQIADNTIGLSLFDPKTGKNKQYRYNSGDPYSLMPGALNAAVEDRDGRLWLVNSGGTVQMWDRNAVQFKLYQHDPLTPASLASNDPIPIFEDRRGAIWIGTFGAGLDRYNPATDDFTHFTHKPGDPSTLPHNYPNGLFEDSKGNFYISTYGGLVLWDPLAGKVKQQLTKDTIWYTIHEDPNDDNLLWMAGYLQQGFCRFNKTSYDYHCYKHSNADTSSPSSDSSIRFIFDARDGDTAWIATWGGGLEQFDKRSGRFTHHRHVDGDTRTISSDQVYDVFQDSKHRLWVSTAVGIDRFDPETGVFQKLGATEGVPDNLVAHQVQEDDYGKLWIPTDAGLIRFDPEASRVMRIYTVEDGLHSTQFFDNSGSKTSDGRLWFGGFKGLTVVDPSALVSNPQKPVVYLTSVRVGGEEIKPSKAFEKLDQLKLDYRDPSFEFGFTGLSFTNARQNRFAYRLEDWDERWQEVAPGEPRTGRFTNLPPGDYTLRIKAANNDGLWNEEGLRVAIHIPPPFWRTWPFYILVAALVFGLGLAIYRLRLAQLQAANRRLEAKVEEGSNEARRRIVEITDNVPCVVFEFEKMRDGTARAPFVSGGMEALIGVSAAEVMKDVSRYFATVLPEDVEGYVADIDRSATTGSDHRFTVRIRHAVTGKIRWLDVDAPAPRVDAEGSARWRGYIQDVTDQKRLEEEQRDSQQRYRALVKAAASLVWETTADGQVEDLPEWRAYTGLSVEEVRGWGWLNAVHPDDRARTAEVWQKAVDSIGFYEIDYRIRRKDGAYLWHLARGIPVLDANGSVRMWVGTCLDIDARRRAEQELQRQAEELNRLNLLADSALDLANAGHWHLPLDNTGCYIPSERAARILGELPNPDHRYRLDEWAEHVREGDEAIAKLTAENFAAAVAGTIPVYDATYLYKRPIDGRLVWIHALGHVVKDAEGKPTDMYGVIQDITAFKQLETDLRLALQKSDDATKAKSAFLANMSHE